MSNIETASVCQSVAGGFCFSCVMMTCENVLQLAYCVVQFLEKDATLTEPVSQSSVKAVIFNHIDSTSNI